MSWYHESAPRPAPGEIHTVTGHPIQPPFPENLQVALVAMGCFWGAEKSYWQLPGVYTTAVGYAAGDTVEPTYEEVCRGGTGHAEAVLVVFDPQVLDYRGVLRHFWENHDPTQGMRQGNDIGSQYRSAIFTLNATQTAVAEQTREQYGAALTRAGYPQITTQIVPLETMARFWYAEGYHQQYLAKNPRGYCPVHATGVACPL